MPPEPAGAPAPRWAYRPGEHWVVAGPGAAALLLGDAALGLAERLWSLLTGEPGDVDRIVEAMTRDGLSRLPSFVVVEPGGGTVRTLLRGTAGVRLRLAGDAGHRTLDALGYRSWREEVVSGVAELAMGDREAEAPSEGGDLRLPLTGGIVRAAELYLVDGEQDGAAVRAAAGGLPVPPPPPRAHRAGPAPSPAPPTPPVAAPVEAPVEAPVLAPVLDPAATLDEAAFDLDRGAAGERVPPGPEPAVEAPLPAPDDGEDEYVAWVAGATRIGTIEDAAVRGAAEDAGEPLPGSEGPAAVAWAPALEPPAPAAGAGAPPPPPAAAAATGPRPMAASTAPASPAGLISSVPFGSARPARAGARETAEPVPPAPGRPTLTEVDSTVLRLPHGAPGAEPASAPRGGWLPAALCGRGHANPPESDRCRVCDLDLADAEQRWVERPVVGRLRFSGPPGVLPVTGPMVIGRAPRADRVSGDALPEMVTVPSADGDVSRSHLRIGVEGWHVLVVDLQAKNGTVVVDPGGEARRLHPGEERLIVPGTRVLLSDDVQFVFEAAP